MEKLKLLKDYLNSGDFDALADADNILFWVDWREEDDAIIDYCESTLNTGHLTSTLKSVDNEMGFEITIHFNGQDTLIPYQGEGADRDTTLTTLNSAIQPAYEIRFCRDSDGSDTLAFIPLTKHEWQELENEFGKKVNYYFSRMPIGGTFFNISMEDMMKRMDARKTEI